MIPLPDFVPFAVFAGTAGLVAYTYLNGSLFGYHATGMAIGYMMCMGQGIIMSNKGVVTAGPGRLQHMKNHMYIQMLGAVMICGGFYAIYRNKDINDKPHFVSTHAKYGLACIVLSVGVVPLGGALGFKWLGIFDKLPGPLQAPTKQAHRLAGAGTYVMGMVVALYGLATPGIYREKLTECMQAATVVSALLVGNSYLQKGNYRKKALTKSS
eukprot:CAMPEP_0197863210 /NCGR_PEP_ID=MMETSP1438-20131217/40507_1 /TAXON_ID=1461541 /ORGANISM="Pterosperma sp., Strain CCMP1384" /LENGTH=211 /DNA_ID=CAMNT_0043481027 /DNA_START=128 /DNA_END=763 /DNA_ORIENTATION=-